MRKPKVERMAFDEAANFIRLLQRELNIELAAYKDGRNQALKEKAYQEAATCASMAAGAKAFAVELASKIQAYCIQPNLSDRQLEELKLK